jgi:hypothetical protein
MPRALLEVSAMTPTHPNARPHGPAPSVGMVPGPARPPARSAVAVLLAGAAVAATSVPLDRSGLGWLVAVLAAVAAL